MRRIFSPNTREKPNTRNLTISGPVNQGKTTLVDCLISRACMIQKPRRDSLPDECDTTKSTAISLLIQREESGTEKETNLYLVNLVDCPNVPPLRPTTSSSDGILLVVDALDGICAQTEIVIRQAIKERAKLVLHLNKLDKAIDMQLDPEVLYQHLQKTIDDVNAIVLHEINNANNGEEENTHVGEPSAYLLDPLKGNVSFGSVKQGWAFTLPQFASIYASMNNNSVPAEKLLPRLWGDCFYNPSTKMFSRSPVSKKGKALDRVFSHFAMRPIRNLLCIDGSHPNSLEQFEMFLSRAGLSLRSSERRRLRGRELLVRAIHKWLPAGDALLALIVDHLPSPVLRSAISKDGSTLSSAPTGVIARANSRVILNSNDGGATRSSKNNNTNDQNNVIALANSRGSSSDANSQSNAAKRLYPLRTSFAHNRCSTGERVSNNDCIGLDFASSVRGMKTIDQFGFDVDSTEMVFLA